MRIIEVTYPFLVLLVIYLYHKVQDHDTVIAKIDTKLDMEDRFQQETPGSEILNDVSNHMKDDDSQQGTMKDDIDQKSMNMNSSVSRKPSDRNYRKDSYIPEVSFISTREYNRQSFVPAHGIRSKKKKAMKEIWAKHQSFPHDSRKAIESAAGNNLMMFKDNQKQNFQKKNKQQPRNVENRKLMDNTTDVISNNENDLYQTSCVLTKAEIIPPCDDNDDVPCSDLALDDKCADTSIIPGYDITWQDAMLQNCQKTCDACSGLSLLENEIQYEEIENVITTFNLSLNVNTDSYVNETSWTFLPQGRNDSIIFNSNESNATSQLENNEHHLIHYNCFISQKQEHGNQLNGDTVSTSTSTCYNFEVHDAFGDGICCEYGDGSFSIKVNTNRTASKIEDKFKDGSVVSSSFCINHENDKIESVGKFITTEQPTYYPIKRWQCRNGLCRCDSKPSLTTNIHENIAFMFEATMLSDSDKLRDVESAQYKAACWVLYDDPYEYDLVEGETHKRRIQRYILAVFYFATSPENWKEHSDFLSSRSECDWIYGISCNEDGNVIKIKLSSNYLDGTVVEELSGLRMLEVLDLFDNNIHGTIQAILGRLSELRSLNLGGNKLEGTIPPQLSRLSKLHDLDLVGNKLEGTIPPQLGRLSELRRLNLGVNDLEGTIPPQLFNATNLEELDLDNNRLEGTIPEMIGNLQKLLSLSLGGNNLSGSIPDTIYSLRNLIYLNLNDNKLSSSISTLIGNLNKLEGLYLYDNMLTGQIPSTIGNLSSLRWLNLFNNMLSGSIPSTMGNMISLDLLLLNNNSLSGPIPESLFDAPKLHILYLQDNSVTGSVPDKFCERFDVRADCRNDVFDPEVICSCCTCTDETPKWNGDCADATIKVEIGHDYDYDYFYGLEWSLTNDATGKIILYDGPYRFEQGLQSYEACVAYSDCFSFNQISPPTLNTNYTIYLNDESIHNGTLQGFLINDDINEDDTIQTLISFSYNEEYQQLTSCYDIKLKCYDEQHIFLKPNTTERIIYNKATEISGRSAIQDTSSPQSKALCWMVKNNHYDNKSEISDTGIIQRYVLAILHFMGPFKLFGNNEKLAKKHECDWNGITCKDNKTKNVTGISLSSEHNQIINGILIDEIQNLKYLEVLEMSQTQLYGTIPRSFSNLWSLKKLDLSSNKIKGTIPTILFRQLNKLEYIDLSDNQLSGSVNDDIGSFSHIRFLSLGKNSLTGSLPLNKFKYTDLEHLDIGENELSELDLSLLLKHTNLKSLDISSNFFVGSLLDHTFTSLLKLEFFNASQNDFSGTILSTFPELSNITHLDLHSNRFKGPIPLSITELQNLQYLNLQGNKLTGSLPSEINQLQSLTILVLSHNELKGSIPFDKKKLQKMERLHLHSNKLEGVAPEFNNIEFYITDCGFPSDSLDPVTCSTCNKCCNSDGGCQSKTPEKLSEVYKTLIFMFSIIGIIVICYALKDRITSSKYLKSFFEEKVKYWNALMLISDKSVYHFLLIDNKTEWYTAVMCGIFQTATLFLFVRSADMVNDTSDREYFMLCPANSLECENLNRVSSYGIFIFGVILIVWLLRDIIGSVKLMLVSFEKRNIDFFFTSAVVFSVTMLSLWTSIIYIDAIAGKNTDMIKDAVVLLFVVEIDERIFQLVESVNPDWVHAIDNNMRNSLVYEGKNLVISSWMKKTSESFVSMRNKIRQRRNNDVPPQLDSEDEDEVSRRNSDVVSGGFHARVLEGESVESNP